jgi:hypothetical protein
MSKDIQNKLREDYKSLGLSNTGNAYLEREV